MASVNTQFDDLTSADCCFSPSTIARMGPAPLCVLPSIDTANADFRMKLKQVLATYTEAGGTGKAALDQAEAVALMPTLDAVFARHVEPSLGSFPRG